MHARGGALIKHAHAHTHTQVWELLKTQQYARTLLYTHFLPGHSEKPAIFTYVHLRPEEDEGEVKVF